MPPQANVSYGSPIAHVSYSEFRYGAKIMGVDLLIGKRLESMWIAPRPIHQAWVDKDTPAIIGDRVSLHFADGTSISVLPCEVEIPNQHPSLGIEMQAITASEEVEKVQRLHETDRLLPATISDSRLWDSLGEGPMSAISLILSTGATVTVRHIYPPMSLGVDVK